jgi:tRNA nucleotidyltransferase/poly(A) polymerase
VTLAARACLRPHETGWLVGGCLRDELLGRVSVDVDIVVDGDAERISRALADRLGGPAFASSDEFGTWRILVGGAHIDVAPLRAAPAGAAARAARSGDPEPDAQAARLAADLRLRDFTVDALARPLTGGDIVDPLNGLDDLAARRLRLCSAGALEDDPLRVLRLARLARHYGLVPDHAATTAAVSAAPALARVSGERVRDELSAVLTGPEAAVAFRDLAVWGALAVVLPEVDALRGVEQNPYHHLDVFEHTLEALTFVGGVVKQLGGEAHLTQPDEAGLPGVAPLVPVTWAVLLHDIGKPAVKVVDEEGRIIFWHHDEAGRQMAQGIAARLRMSNRFAQYLGTLIRQHLRLGFLIREHPLTRRALARYRRDVSPWVFESVVVSLCDRLATRGEKTPAVSMARHYRVARSVWTAVSKAPVPQVLSGDDVMEVLGIEPGPAVGQALDALEEEVEAGEVRTEDEARDFLLQWWQHESDGQEEGPAHA